VPTEPTLIEEVERTNIVVVYLQQWTRFASKNDLYAMNIDCGRNYYSCGGFGYLIRNFRNWRIVEQERRMEYRDNLKEEKNLVVLN